MRLKMKDDPVVFGESHLEQEATADIIPLTSKIPQAETAETQVTVLEPEPNKTPQDVPEVIQIQGRNLKIHFAFNGHDWEAYEALGVPVNAPMTTVTKMYQHLIKTSDTSTFDFYESAYKAIAKRRSVR